MIIWIRLKRTKKEQADKYDILVQLCSPISTIAEEYIQIIQIVQQILQNIQNQENFINSQEFEYVNITQEERNIVVNEIKEFKQWSNNILDLLSKANYTVRFSIKIEQINQKYSEFQQKCLSIVSKQKQDIKKKKLLTNIDNYHKMENQQFKLFILDDKIQMCILISNYSKIQIILQIMKSFNFQKFQAKIKIFIFFFFFK